MMALMAGGALTKIGETDYKKRKDGSQLANGRH